MSKSEEKISQTYRVTRNDVLLVYSCWRYEKADKKFHNKKMYCFQVIVEAPSSVLDRIEYVTYRLPASYPQPNREQKVTDRNRHFELKELAWGSFTLHADVKIKGQDEPISLSLPIILTEEGPRLL